MTIGPEQARGNVVELTTSSPRHITSEGVLAGDQSPSEGVNFGNMLIESLQEVSDLQTNAEALSVQAVVDPESVNAHDVTIAAAKANMALNIAKNVIDRVIDGYKNITNMR